MTKKIHRLLAEASVHTLERIFRNGMVADRAVAQALASHPKWGARDRAFVAETVYEVVRWKRRMAFLAGADELWTLAGLQWTLRGYPCPAWAHWPEVPENVRVQRTAALATAPRAVRESVSDELDTLGAAQLGDRWDLELTALNQPAPVFLRINPLRTSMEAMKSEMAGHGFALEEVTGAPHALRLEDGKSIPAKLKETGRFEIQDVASQQVGPFLQVEPGQLVVDACAGAGGKTLHLAALMQGKGTLHAFDVRETGLMTLKKRAARAGVQVHPALITPELLTKCASQADRVLIDAPCSGSGTLRRQPDLKYRITAGSLLRTQSLQRELLTKFAALVRPGGKLVYATCSILPDENEVQAAWFSQHHEDFTFEEERRISPAATGWDGFYMVRWRRR